jgi:hypothetical protein
MHRSKLYARREAPRPSVFRKPGERIFAGALFGVLLAGCPAEPKGEELGTYRVTMRLSEDTCGQGAVLLQDGHRYTVQLRAEGDHGYWRIPGQTPLEGSYEGARFDFRYQSAVARSAPDAGSFCQLIQTEKLIGAVAVAEDVLDAGVDASALAKAADGEEEEEDEESSYDEDGPLPSEGLVGEHLFTIEPAAGTDCREALSPRGPFAKLPCVVRYDLSCTPTESF